jgi:acetoin:2,6-dichlorophenolindophenol oxidoreductase subunit alpha
VPGHRETNLSADAAWGEGREERGGSFGAPWVLYIQDEPRVGPVRRQAGFELPVLLGDAHAAESRLTNVAKVERKGAVSPELLREFFREMLLIRRFEEKVEERFRAGELPGFLHVAIGQEAVAVGVCRALEEGDVIASTHRAHGHTLAKGTHPNELMAELYGKLEGCSHGYGGSMHLYDIERGNLGANAVVGGGLPAIVGAALAFKFRDEARVAVAFFGDGATNIGTFHESLNLAQLWNVPAVFVCENNHWAESTPAKQHMPIEDMTKRAEAFGMEAMKVDGQEVGKVYEAAAKAVEHARSGRGPVFLVAETYRLVGHYIGDPQVYRSKDELQHLKETQDPIDKLRAELELSDEEFEELDKEVIELVEASVEFAKAGTDPKPEDALKNVYA